MKTFLECRHETWIGTKCIGCGITETEYNKLTQEWYDKQKPRFVESEKHCNLPIKVRLEDMRGLWSECTDKERLEIIKSVIWTANNMHGFYEKVSKLMSNNDFKSTLD